MKTFFLTLLLFMGVNGFSQDKSGDYFLGKWQTEDKELVVEITKQSDGRYNGKVVQAKNPKTKKGEKSVGQPIILEMVLIKGNLEKGTIRDIDSGKEYDAKLINIGKNQLKLKVSVMLISHSEIWTKIN